ncbi:hypothetical protein [Cytobacillus oceanisediminis]|uniref:hypothetical protein n=1 Tax=Cytobacillus oceanisediminis TaxID=665099 RepID=UPI0011A04736|nr:hypothetical protein [Cytobacillus oceanisediminis]
MYIRCRDYQWTHVLAGIYSHFKILRKSIAKKIHHAVTEVNQCIENMQVVNDYLSSLSSTAALLAKELHAVEEVFWSLLYELSETFGNKPDYRNSPRMKLHC